MSRFIGRKDELEELKSLLTKNSTSLIVVKGRRRIGKSRLLEEFSHSLKKSFFFSGLPPAPNSTPQSQRDEFAGQLTRQINSTNFNKEDWSDLF